MKSFYTFFLVLIISVIGGANAMAQGPGGDPPSTFSVTGSGFYNTGGSGLAVGLSGSETGVTYTLYKDGVAQTPTAGGTGSIISFGNQLKGTYTIFGTNVNGTTQMAGNAIIVESDFSYTIANDVQVSDKIIEFDLYIKDLDASLPFELANIQAGILVNPAIYNGGTVTMSIVAGSSQLLAPGGGASSLQPTSVTINMAQNTIKLAPKTPPGAGNGPIIGTTGLGTRICRLRMTNSVAFAANSKADMTFNFTTVPYPTKVFAYIGGLNTQAATDANNCISNAANSTINKTITAQTVTGTAAYCQGTGGVEVGLSGSETGVVYTLYKDAVAQTPTFNGTGSAISFGNKTAGTYTVKSSYVNGANVWGTTDMTGNAIITENPILNASVLISADATTVCDGTTVTLTATPTNGGTTPIYQWYKGATPVGTNSATYSYVPVNGDIITVVMTSNATPCLAGSPATSNGVTITVNPILNASVSIAADATTICAGTAVTLTATPTNGGTTPIYQWYKGATPVGTNSATYSYVPVNGDIITVVMTSNATPCLAGSPATSNGVTITVNPILNASVSIAADATTVCAETTVTLTATPINGGTTPVYQWYKGATPVGTNSAVFGYVPTNGDIITVVMTSNATPCLAGSPATSNGVTITVNPILNASVSIAANATTVCNGTTVTFTATPTNGGTTPIYQWYKGATPVGTNSATYSYIPTNGDIVTVVMTSNATPCLAGSPATSNGVTITVESAVGAAGTITGSPVFAFGTTGIPYSIAPIANATSYIWSYSGTGITINGTGTSITIDYSGSATAGTLSVKGVNSCGEGTSATLQITGNKTLNITSLLFEGLYDGAGKMRQAYNDLGPVLPAGGADNITIELHNATNYANIVYSMPNVQLSTTGSASVTTIPGNYGGSYYITIRHRNSLETTTSAPVSFASITINQSFATPGNVFGGNLVQMLDHHYVIYGGDVNQDGILDGSDFSTTDNEAAMFSTGYMPEDVSGDGLIDGSDFAIIDNNASAFIGTVTP